MMSKVLWPLKCSWSLFLHFSSWLQVGGCSSGHGTHAQGRKKEEGEEGETASTLPLPSFRVLDAFLESLRRLPRSTEWEDLPEGDDSPKGSWEDVRKEK